MSDDKDKGGPITQPVRMDQEFQLQNLRRLAMSQELEAMHQYDNTYLISANNGHEDVSLVRYPDRTVPCAVVS